MFPAFGAGVNDVAEGPPPFFTENPKKPLAPGLLCRAGGGVGVEVGLGAKKPLALAANGGGALTCRSCAARLPVIGATALTCAARDGAGDV